MSSTILLLKLKHFQRGEKSKNYCGGKKSKKYLFILVYHSHSIYVCVAVVPACTLK